MSTFYFQDPENVCVACHEYMPHNCYVCIECCECDTCRYEAYGEEE